MSDQAPRELDGYAGTPFRAARKDPLLQRAVPVPVAGELRAYGAGKARGALIAGLTVAALAIPSAMAYAELAGLTARRRVVRAGFLWWGTPAFVRAWAQLIDDRGPARRPAGDALRAPFDDCRAIATRRAARPTWREPKRLRAIRAPRGNAVMSRAPVLLRFPPGLPEGSCPRLSSRPRPEGCRRARVRSASPASRSPP